MRRREQVLHDGFDGGPLSRGKQRQHGEALVEGGFVIGDHFVDLGLQCGDLFGGVFVAFRQSGEALEEGRLPPEQFAGLLLQEGKRGLHVVRFSVGKGACCKGADGGAARFGEGAEEVAAKLAEDRPHLLAGDAGDHPGHPGIVGVLRDDGGELGGVSDGGDLEEEGAVGVFG